MAVHVLVIVRSTGHAPATVTSLKVIVGEPVQLSEAVAVPVTAGKELCVHWMVILAGHVITGGVLSSTNIVCRQVEALPQASVAVQVLLIVRSCVQTPAIVTSLKVMVGAPPQLSVAVAVPVLAGNVLAVHWIVMFGGHTMAGPMLSSTKMV